MAFKDGSVWIKATWLLITIGFVVWLSAGGYTYSSLINSDTANAFDAFMIIGVVAYFTSVMLTFLYTTISETAGNKIVLIIDLVMAFIAGLSAIIVLAIGQAVTFSDRMAYSAICAIVSGVFCVLELVGGGKSSGGAGGST